MYQLNQHLIFLKLDSVSINKTEFVTEFVTVKVFTESKFDVNYVNIVKSKTQQVGVFRSNGMFGTKHLKINKCQTNQQSTKYSNVNKETKLLGNTKYNQVKLLLVVFASAYLYQVSIKLH